MAVRRAAPFPDPDFGAVWFGDRAAVWYWSRERVSTLAGSAIHRARHVPEAQYRGEIHERALELLELPNGCEARVWREGRLVASRWWPRPPDAAAWAELLRGCGEDTQQSLPPPPPAAPCRESPWHRPQALDIPGSIAPHLPRIALGAGALVIGLFAFKVGEIARAAWALGQARAETERLGGDLARILGAREQADSERQAIDTLLALRPPASQTTLLGELTTAMPAGDWRIRVWSMPNRESVEATLSMARPDPQAIVAAWEASGRYRDVSVELTRRTDEIIVRARIVAPGAAR